MQRKTIFLMGAPLPSHLDWASDDLLHTPLPPFQGTEHEQDRSSHHDSVKWRILQPVQSEVWKGDPHDFYYGPEDPGFLTTHQLEAVESQSTCNPEYESALSQFYDHSFAVHETSEISASGLPEDEITQQSETGLESLLAPVAATPNKAQASEVPPVLRISGKISDLQGIPTARHLQSIVPQTMTVNLIVGIIAVHPPRRVITRQWKAEYDIIELIVGDETRTGFGVDFWVVPDKSSGAKNQEIAGLGRSLATLRPQDIILLRTVGLSSFRDRVYGQSMRGGMTKVDLLYRRLVDATDAGGFYQGGIPARSSHGDDLLRKVRRVRDWVLRFVGTTEGVGGGVSGMSQARGLRLPPDTQ